MADVTRYCVHYMSESGKPWIAGDVIAMVRNEDRIIVGHSSGGPDSTVSEGISYFPAARQRPQLPRGGQIPRPLRTDICRRNYMPDRCGLWGRR